MLKTFLLSIKSRMKLSWFARRATIFTELISGKDFSSTISQEKLGYSIEQINLGSPSSKKSLIKIFKEIDVNDNDRILDIGCAKGFAINFFLKMPFSRVDGLEISSKLATICKKNFSKEDRIKIFNIDAVDFDNYSDYNYFYMYNPFPSSHILKSVLEKILSCHFKNKIFFIYNNAKNHEVFYEAGLKLHKKIKDPISPKKDIMIFCTHN